MHRFNCVQCGAEIVVTQDSLQPFIKCKGCGSHEKVPLPSGNAPKYKVLNDKERARSELRESISEIEKSELPKVDEEDKPVVAARIAPPVIAAKKSASGWTAKSPDFRKGKKPIEAKQILIDALGREGFDMVFEMVAGYLTEANREKKMAKKSKVIQKLMKFKVSGEMAAQAVEYAEKSPVTQEILWGNYKSSFFLGLGIFAVGLSISLLIHFLANPGPGFYLFQIPFAVGFAYAANSAINMAGLRFEKLQSDSVHYAFMTIVTLLIAFYVIWGIYF